MFVGPCQQFHLPLLLFHAFLFSIPDYKEKQDGEMVQGCLKVIVGFKSVNVNIQNEAWKQNIHTFVHGTRGSLLPVETTYPKLIWNFELYLRYNELFML